LWEEAVENTGMYTMAMPKEHFHQPWDWRQKILVLHYTEVLVNKGSCFAMAIIYILVSSKASPHIPL
jgi:hypothetical protein